MIGDCHLLDLDLAHATGRRSRLALPGLGHMGWVAHGMRQRRRGARRWARWLCVCDPHIAITTKIFVCTGDAVHIREAHEISS